MSASHFVFQQQCGLIEAGDEEIEVSVAIDISCRESASDSVEGTEFVGAGGIFEVVAAAQQQQLVFSVSVPEVAGIRAVGLSADTAVYGSEIKVAIVIQIGQGGAESGQGKGHAVHVPCGRKFLEAAGLIDADGVGFAIEICDDDIGQLVVVDVGDGDSHAALALSGGISGDTAEYSFFFEGSVVLIDPEEVWMSIVGDENVDPAVTVPVAGGSSESGTAERCNAGGGGNVGQESLGGLRVGFGGGDLSA